MQLAGIDEEAGRTVDGLAMENGVWKMHDAGDEAVATYSVIEYCTINLINGGPETNDIVPKFYAVYIF